MNNCQFTQPNTVSFELPSWLDSFAKRYQPCTDVKIQMAFVIAAAHKNIEHHTGGPFAAAVFEKQTGKLVSLGVNLVTTQGMSFLHAEIVAVAIAQRKLGTYNLGECSPTKHELITSCEPCAMCLGAIPWSGVGHISMAAREQDARAIGFDEGAKPDNWINTLIERGITVTQDINRNEAIAVLKIYKQEHGTIYNAPNT